MAAVRRLCFALPCDVRHVLQPAWLRGGGTTGPDFKGPRSVRAEGVWSTHTGEGTYLLQLGPRSVERGRG